jgi:hypothetical protein
LDPNVVFGQLKEVEDNLSVVKGAVSAVLTAGDAVFNIAEGGLGAAVHKLALAVDMLVANQEKLLSAVVDSAGSGHASQPRSYATAAAGSSSAPKGKGKPSQDNKPTEEQTRKKNLRQAILKAERSTVIFNAHLGNVPVMNKDTLARKVTLFLHDKAMRDGEYSENPRHAEEAVDDFLSCASLDFLGRGSKPFYNRKKPDDEQNNTFCTVPVKLTWKTKGERIRAEQSIRRVCKAKCSTPYPKEIRSLMDEVLKAGQSAKPGCFIRVRVNQESLSVVAHAREGDVWTDLGLKKDIPLDIPGATDPANQDDESEMETIS